MKTLTQIVEALLVVLSPLAFWTAWNLLTEKVLLGGCRLLP